MKTACETWLAGKLIKPTTHSAYSAALAPIIEKYSDRPVQEIVKADVEKLVVELRDGTGPRGVWARTSINPMLARWRSVWKDLQAQGILPRDVIGLVEPLRRPSGAQDLKLDDVLSEAEVEQLIDAHAVSAPAADADSKMVREMFVHLALLGLRRGELAGLRCVFPIRVRTMFNSMSSSPSRFRRSRALSTPGSDPSTLRAASIPTS
ncbi:site-specific integrase [Mycolicibacterium neworleansense]|uniref:Gp41 protein n=1 Tax=Mycolicibacterium neworleansense TaxID=146018 RepID=A0A0H5RTV2_9MYCO|nr:hypothetical protein [Mycolicibacterium neworleansense]MCV7362843.1 hypothetical protein [Mycolicibacterium neworleansense]CRZ17585.1 gp41 protein [Mycolicibacterium neworleansense]